MDTASTSEQQLTEFMVGRKVDLDIERPVVEKTRPLLDSMLSVMDIEGANPIPKRSSGIKDMEMPFSKIIIIITHKLNEVLELSDRVAILRKGEYICTAR